jgi:hypothetical protein
MNSSSRRLQKTPSFNRLVPLIIALLLCWQNADASNMQSWSVPWADWLSDEETQQNHDDETWDFMANSGIANCGATYIYRHYGAIDAYPYKFELPPSKSAKPHRIGYPTRVLESSQYTYFLGVCEIGGGHPDILAFYLKEDPATAQYVYYRRHSQQYKTEEKFEFPNLSNIISFETNNYNRMTGKIVFFNGNIVFLTAKNNKGFLTSVDLLNTGKIIVQKEFISKYWEYVISMDACLLDISEKPYLAVAVLGGDYNKDHDPAPKCFGTWTVCDGFLLIMDQNFGQQSHVIPVRNEEARFQDIARGNWYGTRNIQVVRGGVYQGGKGDRLQIITRGISGLFYDKGTNYSFMTRYEFDAQALTLKYADLYYNEEMGVKGTSNIREQSFSLFPIVSEKAGAGNGDYKGFDQYIFYINAVGVEGRKYAWSTVGCFRSDYLVPVKSETVEGNKIEYPARPEMSNDPATWTLIGVIYGPPPYSMQGYTYKDAYESDKEFSRFSFVNKHGDSLATKMSITGSMKFGAKDDDVGGSIEFGAERSVVHTDESRSELKYFWTHNSDDTSQIGWMVVNTPHFEVQAYDRYDWNGTIITGSRVWASNCTDKNDSTVSYVPFNMSNPDAESFSAGMRPYPLSSRYSDTKWKIDPTVSGGAGVEKIASVDMTAGNGGSCVANFAKGTNDCRTWSAYVRGKAKWGFAAASLSLSYGHESVASSEDNVTFSMYLLPAKEHAKDVLSSLTATAYWLNANSTDCFWIPTAFKTNGNIQKPWCVVYRVQAWKPKPGTSELTTCDVAAIAEPAEGGVVTLTALDGPFDVIDNEVVVTKGRTLKITAEANDGWRFAGWKPYGPQVSVDTPKRPETEVDVQDVGSATIAAQFVPVLAKKFKVAKKDGDTCDFVISGADLPDAFDNDASPADMRVALIIGDMSISCPKESWQEDGDTSTSSFTPSGWTDPDANCTLRLDRKRDTWELSVTGAENVNDFMLSCASGTAIVGLSSNSETMTLVKIPVQSRSSIAFAPIPENDYSEATAESGNSSEAYRIDLSEAIVKTHSAGSRSGRGSASLSISNLKCDPGLVDSESITLKVNNRSFELARRQHAGRGKSVYRGKDQDGIKVSLSYDNKKQVMTLAFYGNGRAYQGVSEIFGRNITIAISDDADSGEGNLISEVQSMSASLGKR